MSAFEDYVYNRLSGISHNDMSRAEQKIAGYMTAMGAYYWVSQGGEPYLVKDENQETNKEYSDDEQMF